MGEERPPQVLGYGRTSTAHQEMSPEVQERQIKIWCDYQLKSGKLPAETIFLDTLMDVDVGSKLPLLERPKGQLIPVLLNRGDTLVVAKHDRAFRSGADTELTLEKLTAAGIRMVMLNLNIDTSTHDGMMMATIFGAAARWERENGRRRTLESMAYRKSKGLPVGKPYIGWGTAGERGKRYWVPCIEKRKVSMFCLDRLLRGWSVRQIREELDAHKQRYSLKKVPTRDWVVQHAVYAALEFPCMSSEAIREKYGRNCFSISFAIDQWEIRHGKPRSSSVISTGHAG